MHKYNHNSSKLNEGLEKNDLDRLVHNEVHVDEFKSKMGDDADIAVLSFKVDSKEPGLDLVSFIEGGYEWVLDADVSSGELDDGEYLVFIELERNEELIGNLLKLLDDLQNITNIEPGDWRFQYRKDGATLPLTVDTIKKLVPLTPEEYNSRYGDKKLQAMQEAAGIRITRKAPRNEWTDYLRNTARIIR